LHYTLPITVLQCINIVRQIKYPTMCGKVIVVQMVSPSQMVSVRLTEEEIFEIERRVGFDGMRNRSDVLRRGLHKLLDETAAGNVGRRQTVRISEGVSQQLKILEQMLEIDASSAMALGIGLLLEQQTEKMDTRVTDALSVLKDIELRGSHEDHTE
jgi:Arc/MetJ-type ribon-helix-helix transcriptional regulator